MKRRKVAETIVENVEIVKVIGKQGLPFEDLGMRRLII